MSKNITYAIHKQTGIVYSRLDSKMAIPVLQYEKMLPENNFAPTYALESFDVTALVSEWNDLVWTRKIPVDIKNRHRVFWGRKPLEQ